jgi:hypothetical protein
MMSFNLGVCSSKEFRAGFAIRTYRYNSVVMCAGNSAHHWSISLGNYRKTLRVRAVQVWPQDLSINSESFQMFLTTED